MRAVAIVQARMTSTRLPGKVMFTLGQRPVIHHVLSACRRIHGINDVVCAVPDSPESAPIIAEAEALGCGVTVGPEHDVLARYDKAAMESHANVIVRVTADCPMIDPVVCGLVLSPVLAGCADYCSNVNPRTYPKGLDCEAFTAALLYRAHKEAEDPYEREHVTPYMQTADRVRRFNLDGPGDTGNYSLDTPEDYRRLLALFETGRDWRQA